MGLLIRAIILTGMARLVLRLLPFRTARRCLLAAGSWPRASWSRRRGSLDDARAVGRTIASGCRRVAGRRSCLAQALAAEALLAGEGIPARLFIGVRRGPGRALEAHAWVESEGRLIAGGRRDLLLYTPLPSLTAPVGEDGR